MSTTLPKRSNRQNMSVGDIKNSGEKSKNKFLVNNESDEDNTQKTNQRKHIVSSKTITAYSPYSNKSNKIIPPKANSDKAFLQNIPIWELLKIGSGTSQEDIGEALKQQTISDVALMIGQKIQDFKLEYVKQEFINIQLKEEIETIKQNSVSQSQFIVDPDTSFKQYAKVHQANQRWKSLFFAEARTVVDMCKNHSEITEELEKYRQYIDKLEDKLSLQEDKYLKLFEMYHNKDIENRSDNLPSINQKKGGESSKKQDNLKSQLETLNQEKQLMSSQYQELSTQNQKMLRQLQDELKRHHAIQDLRIGDLQYIMSLENKIEEMTFH